MAENENQSPQAPSITQVEEWVNEFALLYAQAHYSLPPTAFRVFLWPTAKYHVNLVAGPTAEIHLGVFPNHHPFDKSAARAFNDSLTRAIDRIASQHLYSTFAIEKVTHILDRETQRKAWFKEKFGYEWEMIPMMLGDEELSIRTVERVEVIHKQTGLREVVEHEHGKQRSWYIARDIAKARLSRRVQELRTQEAVKKDNELPFPASA